MIEVLAGTVTPDVAIETPLGWLSDWDGEMLAVALMYAVKRLTWAYVEVERDRALFSDELRD